MSCLYGQAEKFGPHDPGDLCRFLQELGLLHLSGDTWHWTSDDPADAVSLRAVTSDNFVVVDSAANENKVIAEVDFPSALTTLHEAIYLHARGSSRWSVSTR